MKILLLTDKMHSGGAETHILTLAAELKKRGHTPVVASSGGSLCGALKKSGISHLRLPLDKKDPRALLFCYISLDKLISKGGFAVVHSHARLPSFLAARLAKKHRLPLVCTAHAHFSLSHARKALSRWGDSTIAVSEDLKQYLIEGYSLAPENITVIPNPIDSHRLLTRRSEPNIPTVAFISRLDRDCSRGAILLCAIAPRLCARFGRIRINIGGGGELFPSFLKLAKRTNQKLGFECISILGRVDELAEFFSSASIFVGVSRAAMEAALSGLPVIICGNEGFAGRLTAGNFETLSYGNFCARGHEKASADRLYSEICSLLDEDPEKLMKSADAIRTLMLTLTDTKTCATRTLGVYSAAKPPSKKKSAELLLCGYYGFSNMGDDALLRAAIKRAEREFPLLSVAVLTKNGRRDSARFGVPCINRRSPFALFAALAKCKVLVFGGGTLFQDSTSLRSLLYYACLILTADRLGAKCYLWGNGIGELSSPLAKKLTAMAIRACSAAYFRDSASFETAKRLSCGERIYLESDLASKTEPSTDERAEFILNSIFGEKRRPRFIIAAPKKAEGVNDLIRELLNAQRKGIAVLFVIMHEKEDAAITKRLCKLCRGKTVKGIGYADLLALAKRSEGVYSMRLHGLLAAKSAGVPYKSFGNDQKLKRV